MTVEVDFIVLTATVRCICFLRTLHAPTECLLRVIRRASTTRNRWLAKFISSITTFGTDHYRISAPLQLSAKQMDCPMVRLSMLMGTFGLHSGEDRRSLACRTTA